MSLRVVEPGLFTLVVDFGRPHCRSLGVPVGGAADRTSLVLGNALVGNPPDAAALEFSLDGPTLEAECQVAGVIVGAPFEIRSNRQPLDVGTTFTLSPGEVLRIGGTSRGMRGYLCVRGGLQVAAVLGSRSGLEPLRAGAVLPCSSSNMRARAVRIAELQPTDPDQAQILRVIPGPQVDWFPPDALSAPTGLGGVFTVSPASNRMGLRLVGPALPFPERELVSEPVCPGTVQVTRDGQCIILGVDGQTIGGYPKIAQVIQADLDALGQLRPGARVAFRPISLAEAETLYHEKQRWLNEWVTRLRTTFEGWK